jgi:hypothetical protein
MARNMAQGMVVAETVSVDGRNRDDESHQDSWDLHYTS